MRPLPEEFVSKALELVLRLAAVSSVEKMKIEDAANTLFDFWSQVTAQFETDWDDLMG